MSRNGQRASLAPFIAAARSDLPAPEQLSLLLPAAERATRGPSAIEAGARSAVATAKLITGAGLAVALVGALATVQYASPRRSDAAQRAAVPAPAASAAPAVATSPRSHAAPVAAIAAADRPVPAASRSASAASVPAQRRARDVARVRAGKLPVVHGATSAAEPAPPAVDPAAESALVERARQALHGDPARTLALAAEHAARFPSGLLALEREALAIRALSSLGREGEARARLDRLAVVHPRSAHVAQLRRMLSAREAGAR